MSARGTRIRGRALDELCAGTFDVLVIGAGIVGARVAFEAVRAGLRVALVDAGDFGGATSSASGKLVHGGLRYLRSGDVRLVRQARREQRILADLIAPHLVRRLPMLLASAERGLSRFATTTAGPLVYWALSGFRSSAPRLVGNSMVQSLVPYLRSAGPCTILQEEVTDDGRLTLATVRAAVRAGVVAVNHARVIELRSSYRGTSRAVLECREGIFENRSRSVVNATGPWMDLVRSLVDPRSVPAVRLSKGVHLALSPEEEWRAAVALSLDRSRHVYAVPWHGVLLLGTTDTLYEGDPSAVAPEVDDEAFLLDAASRFLPEEMLGQVRASYAGLRVLPPGGGTTAEASREHIVVVDPGGMVSVGGGKLTTHRLIALDVLRRLPASVRPRKLSPSLEPLPGASAPDLQALRANLDEPVVEHLVRLYGGEAGNLLRYAAHPDALEKVHPDAPDIWAQAYYAADEEWALTVEDIVRRRTTLGICGAATSEVRDRVASILSRDNSLLSAGP